MSGKEKLIFEDAIIKNTTEATYLVSLETGNILYANPAFEKMFGYAPGEMIGKPVLIVNAPTDKTPEQTAQEIIEVIEKTGGWSGEVENIKKDGTRFISYAQGKMSHDKRHGRVIVISHKDIAEHKKTQQALRESQERYKHLFDNAPISIWVEDYTEIIDYLEKIKQSGVTDFEGYLNEHPEELFKCSDLIKVLDVNQKSMILFKAKTKDALMSTIQNIFSDETLPVFKKSLLSIFKGEKSFVSECVFQTLDKEKLFTILKWERIDHKVIVSIQDITERKKAEQEVIRIKNMFKQLFDNMSSCVAIYNAVDNGEDFVFVDFNKAGQKAEQIARQDIIGRRVTEVFPGVKDFGIFDVFKRVWETGQEEYFPVKQYKDNRICGWRENYVYKLNSGEIVAIYDDVTEKKKMEEKEKILVVEKAAANAAQQKALELAEAYQELKDTQLQLIQAEKLTGIGQLGAGIAHELNSPLTGLLSLLRSYKKEKDPSSEEYIDLVEMEKACTHMADIVRSLSAFSRQTMEQLELVDCNEAIETTLSFSGYYFKGDKLKIEKNYAHNLWLIKASKNQIQQVIVNMVTNACDAMPEQGKFTITTRNIEEKEHKWVEMEFRDTGCGMNPENLEKIFDPFFTTKRPGGGIGLGLSIVHKIVENHKGRIKVQSKEGEGTVFRVRLPVSGEGNNEQS
ncbi:MAG: ATP-binding protein [Candidatus Omnitrophota bacterium]